MVKVTKKPVKRSSKGAPKLPSWWQPGFVPCVARDPASAMGAPFNRVYMLAPTFQGTLAVQRWANVSSLLGVRDRVIPNSQIRLYTHEDISLQSALSDLKKQMLTEGATPEAVRLVHEHSPFTEEELSTMANKLAKKTAPAKKADATKVAPKSTAKKDTAKASAKPKPEGSSPVGTARNFKYKTLMTAKQAGEKLRDGSWTARMVDIIMSHKDAASAREALAADAEFNEKRLDFGWAIKKGFISVTETA